MKAFFALIYEEIPFFEREIFSCFNDFPSYHISSSVLHSLDNLNVGMGKVLRVNEMLVLNFIKKLDYN